MKQSLKQERRLHPRLDHTLPVKIAANGYDFITTTQNVSCVGAYCRINKYIPPFTKIMVRLALPIITDNKTKNYSVECKGVIVRTEDESEGGFNIAIFFNDIKGSQRQKISEYISQFLPQNFSSPRKKI
ncbi:MAG: PilZ domain-containing protein [Candidatus Omnitrophica bacterium]|nr:PilZ domain-containing protein [Candidatus Omnitrophota bacterium]MDD5166411.1 PilZ domain-containing protein [Candidatus Omnitrophota bacterium]